MYSIRLQEMPQWWVSSTLHIHTKVILLRNPFLLLWQLFNTAWQYIFIFKYEICFLKSDIFVDDFVLCMCCFPNENPATLGSFLLFICTIIFRIKQAKSASIQFSEHVYFYRKVSLSDFVCHCFCLTWQTILNTKTYLFLLFLHSSFRM